MDLGLDAKASTHPHSFFLLRKRTADYNLESVVSAHNLTKSALTIELDLLSS